MESQRFKTLLATEANSILLAAHEGASSGNDDENDDEIKQAKPPSKKASLFATFKLSEPEKSNDSDREVSLYLSEPTLSDFDSNPLSYRKINSVRLPTLALLARKLLCVPATLAPIERVFSTTGHIVSPFRSCLKHEMVEKLVFLKKEHIVWGKDLMV